MDHTFSTQYLRWYNKGEYLHRNTDPMEHIYYLQKGLAAVYRVTENGQDEIIRYVRTGTFIGAPALFTLTKGLADSDTSIRACSDCKVYKIPFDHFLQTARAHPAILEQIIVELSLESRYFRLLMTYTAHHRSANALALLLTNLMEETDGQLIISQYTTFTDMASYLKTHKITVSRIIKKLTELGVLTKIDGQLHVTDPARLEAYAHGQELIYWDKKNAASELR